MADRRLFITELFVWDGEDKLGEPSASEYYAEVGTDKEKFEENAFGYAAEKYKTDNITPGKNLARGLSGVREYFDKEMIDEFESGILDLKDVWQRPCSFEVTVPTIAVMRTSAYDGKLFVLGGKAEKMRGYSFWANKEGDARATCQWRQSSPHTIELRFWEDKNIRMEKYDYNTKTKDYKEVPARFMREIYDYLEKRVNVLGKGANRQQKSNDDELPFN